MHVRCPFKLFHEPFFFENNINACLALLLLDCMSILSFLLQFLISVPLQLEQPVEHLEK